MPNLDIFQVGTRVTWFIYNYDGVILQHGGGMVIGLIPEDPDLFLEILKDGCGNVMTIASQDCILEKEWSDNLSVR